MTALVPSPLGIGLRRSGAGPRAIASRRANQAPRRARLRAAWVVLALSLTAATTCAQTAAPAPPAAPASREAPLTAADPALETKVLKIAAELRCLVCQNQTIADSNAGLAVDLRNQVREMLRAGQSEEQIRDYMTARYGDFVLYRPPVKSTTALLWYGPGALLVIALIVFALLLRRRSRLPADRFEADPQDSEVHAAR